MTGMFQHPLDRLPLPEGPYEVAQTDWHYQALPSTCGHCGCVHVNQQCPRIKAIEYHPNGTVKRIEYHTPTTEK